jgi:DNA invertase Pin-like site-specific DNA recombinase
MAALTSAARSCWGPMAAARQHHRRSEIISACALLASRIKWKMGRAMFTIIGAMAELESSLISERVTAGMRSAQTRGKHLGRPAIPQRVIREIEALATSTDLSIRQIQSKIAGRASRGIVGEIAKRARAGQPTVL